jgi:hypothetical protein
LHSDEAADEEDKDQQTAECERAVAVTTALLTMLGGVQ